MHETIFLQFYSRRKSGVYNLLNGFSDTYDLCRRHGEPRWYPEAPDKRNERQYDHYAANPPPIRKGTVFISALDVNHLYQSWVWADLHPDITFVVGGPVAAEINTDGPRRQPAYVRVDDPAALPQNFVLTGKSVETWFGVPDFSGPWRLELPGGIAPDSPIYFSYTLDNICFWNRCIYCNMGCHDRQNNRRRTDMAFEFQHLPFEGVKQVRLNTGSLTPHHIRNLLPLLPRGETFQYRTFMRPAAAETRALRDAIAAAQGPLPEMVLGFGVEFPSMRMLAHIQKGFTPEEMMTALELCSAHHIRVNGNVIVGWNNLTPGDIDALASFFDRMPHGAFRTLQLRWLFAHPFTAIHDRYRGTPRTFGPFYEGFSVALDNAEQIALNRTAVEIILRHGPMKGYTVQGLAKVKEHLD
ncbi:MAG: hypothetical protein HKP58_06145 [Desulfatitalea sp.]|nr:hypothetical protein [Desulfatitalea sp.]NNJ99977.1 hypothetical protein [Desulfatitalea sp.]